jgi:hypothetical protein
MAHVIAILGMIVAALSSSPGAQSPEDLPARQPPPRVEIEPLNRFGAQKDPYKDLFSPRVEIRVKPVTRVHELNPRVICGMVVVDVDPSVDPGIRAPKRAEQDLTYTMRVEQPPICTGE